MISVITPVYNGARFIESCLQCVIDQNCPGVEHIVIDGGSSDATPAILMAYAERHRHIRWISEKDRGQSDAMNKGISLAKGDIIGVLNVDDFYEPGALQRVAELFQTLLEPSLLVGNCNMWGDDGKLLDVNKPSHLKLADLLIGDEARYPFPVNASQYFYHRSLHDTMGMYDIEEQFALDIDFLLRAIPHAHVSYIDEVLGNYRLIKGTKTHDDRAAGRMEARFRKLLHAHRKNSSLYQRSRVLLLGYVYRYWRIIQKRIREG